MDFKLALIKILFCLVAIMYYYFKNELNKTRDGADELLNINEQLRYTIQMGIYQRFKKNDKLPEKEQPRHFEYFVANIMEDLYGSRTYVTPNSGDFGVDVIEAREDGEYLGQMKCYEGPVDYEPIAILHSRMVKDRSKGGYVVTTSKFTEKAKQYHRELNANIELIEGDQLVDMYLESLHERASDATLNLGSATM